VGQRSLLPFRSSRLPKFSDPTFKEHQGEEFLFVHAGQVEVDFMNERVLLEQGDALHFNAQTPHRLRPVGACSRRSCWSWFTTRTNEQEGRGMPHAFWTVTHSRHYDNVPLHILCVDILTSSPISIEFYYGVGSLT
jgi:glyoxylate utilization-related uncharacterized protein